MSNILAVCIFLAVACNGFITNPSGRMVRPLFAEVAESTNKAPEAEINRRRNLAIISHPDAGKTTVTEKLLLYGGALQQAGAVRQKAEQRGTQSDFMSIEQERGISISSTVMNFDYNGKRVNILDTPGHDKYTQVCMQFLFARNKILLRPNFLLFGIRYRTSVRIHTELWLLQITVSC